MEVMMMNYRLSDVCKIKYGKDHKKLSDGEVPVYGSGGIIRYVDTALYTESSVLIPRKGTLGNLFFVDKPFWTVDTLFYTEIDESKVIPAYLYYKLKTMDLANLNVGSAVPSLTTAILNQINLKVPSLSIQREIVKILTSLDDKIAVNNNINHHLEQMISTIFENTFVDKCNTIKLQLQNVADISNGFSFKSTNLIDSPTGECRAVFKMGNIIAGGGISHSSTKSWVSHKNYPDNKFLSCTGDILMSMTDMKNNVRLLGHTALIDKNSEYYVNQRVGIIRSKNKNEWMYLYPLTNSQGFINILRSRANSGVQVNLTTTTIKEMEFQFPKEDAMRNYISSVSPLFFNKFLLEQEIISLKSLRDTLLPKLLSGEISVSQATK